MERVVLLSGARTAIGGFGGSLAEIPAAQLGAAVARVALERSGVRPEQVDDVIFGCVGQVGSDAYIARAVSLGAGLPVEVPAYTVNRLCGSGLQSIGSGAEAIQSGRAEVVLAGGTESMSRLPYLVPDLRWGRRMGQAVMEDALTLTLTDPFNRYHMGVTAENLAAQYSISRQEQDELALLSQRRAGEAIRAGRFAEEIVPVEVPGKKGQATVFATDEHPRPDTPPERLASLKPAFKEGGTVTAGNASGINDGAAAVVLMSERRAKALGLRPRLELLGYAVAGVKPEIMGIGPVPAVRKVLERTGLGLDQIEVVELNEAFAAQALAVTKELGLVWSRVNPNGGAIALGHPVGATGAILTVKLMHDMERRGLSLGMVTLCIGGGQGIAAVFRRWEG